MELCPICGAVNAHETRQCPRIGKIVCAVCCAKCEHYHADPRSPGACWFYRSEEGRKKQQEELDASYLAMMNKKAECIRGLYSEKNKGDSKAAR